MHSSTYSTRSAVGKSPARAGAAPIAPPASAIAAIAALLVAHVIIGLRLLWSRLTRSSRRAAIIAHAAAGLAAAAAACAAAPPALRLEQLAPGVYVQPGDVAPPSAANRGRVANRGVLVGPTGIVLVNTGASREDGEALVAAVRRLATQPIVAAIDTQATPDQVLGNSAISALGAVIIAHRATDAFMVRNCAACIRATEADIGPRPAGSTRIVRPSRLIDRSTDLDLGGRSLSLLHFGWTAQPGSLAVLDRASGILFTGNLADFDVLPDVRTARVGAWRDALKALRDLAPARVVPGHGPVAGAERLDEVARYLGELQDATATAYRNGVDLQRATRTVAADAFRGWVGYDRLQPSNVHFTYLSLEHAELEAIQPRR